MRCAMRDAVSIPVTAGSVAAGRELDARIPGATLGLIDGMGHDLPKQLWPRFFAGIAGPAAPA